MDQLGTRHSESLAFVCTRMGIEATKKVYCLRTVKQNAKHVLSSEYVRKHNLS